MPEENKIKKEEKMVDIDTSGPETEVSLPEETVEKVEETISTEQEQETVIENKQESKKQDEEKKNLTTALLLDSKNKLVLTSLLSTTLNINTAINFGRYIYVFRIYSNKIHYINLNDRIGKSPLLLEVKKIKSFDVDWPEDFEFVSNLIASGVRNV